MGIGVSSSRIDLSWTASTDNVGGACYKIYRDDVEVGTSATTSYSDTGLTVSTIYSYTIIAYDAADNLSSESNPALAATLESALGILKAMQMIHQARIIRGPTITVRT